MSSHWRRSTWFDLGCGADLPERHGPWKTVHNRFRRWSRNGLSTRTPSGVRWAWQAAVGGVDRRQCPRSHHVRPGHGRYPVPAAGSRPPTRPTGAGDRRQGLPDPRRPRRPAPTAHPRRHPRTPRPASQPDPPGQRGRAPTGVRPHRLPTTRHRRTPHQPTRTVPGHRHPLRQDSPVLPSDARRGHPHPMGVRSTALPQPGRASGRRRRRGTSGPPGRAGPRTPPPRA